jgi:hypothetical protein
MVLVCEMFCHAVTLARLMLIDACHVFTRNIYCARMHYRVVPEQYFDQGFKLARLKESAP